MGEEQVDYWGSFATPVFDAQFAGLMYPHRMQFGTSLNRGGDAVPDIDGNVFDRGHHAIEWLDLAVQQPVIVYIQHLVFENLPQVLQIEDHAGHRVRIALD